MKFIVMLLCLAVAQDTDLDTGDNNAQRLIDFQYYFVYQGQYATLQSTQCPAIAAEQTPRLIAIDGTKQTYAWTMNCSSSEQCAKNITFDNKFPGTSICCCSYSTAVAVLISVILLLI